VTIVYVETNFLVGFATGRDREAAELLVHAGSGFRWTIPSICFFESLSWMEGEIKRRNLFVQGLREQIVQNVT